MQPVCPKCDAALIIASLGGVELDICYRCHGLWFDSGELEALLEQTGAASQDPLLACQHLPGTLPKGKKHLCPRCDEPLAEVEVMQGGSCLVRIDWCQLGHGIWFDADEVQQLLTSFPQQCRTSETVRFINEVVGTKDMQEQRSGKWAD